MGCGASVPVDEESLTKEKTLTKVDPTSSTSDELASSEKAELKEVWSQIEDWVKTPSSNPRDEDDELSSKMQAKDMLFDKPEDFIKGYKLPDLTRSMRQEFETNDGSAFGHDWKAEFAYVVDHPAIEVTEKTERIVEKFRVVGLPKGAIGKRDVGHARMTLQDFVSDRSSNLRLAQVAR